MRHAYFLLVLFVIVGAAFGQVDMNKYNVEVLAIDPEYKVGFLQGFIWEEVNGFQEPIPDIVVQSESGDEWITDKEGCFILPWGKKSPIEVLTCFDKDNLYQPIRVAVRTNEWLTAVKMYPKSTPCGIIKNVDGGSVTDPVNGIELKLVAGSLINDKLIEVTITGTSWCGHNRPILKVKDDQGNETELPGAMWGEGGFSINVKGDVTGEPGIEENYPINLLSGNEIYIPIPLDYDYTLLKGPIAAYYYDWKTFKYAKWGDIEFVDDGKRYGYVITGFDHFTDGEVINWPGGWVFYDTGPIPDTKNGLPFTILPGYALDAYFAGVGLKNIQLWDFNKKLLVKCCIPFKIGGIEYNALPIQAHLKYEMTVKVAYSDSSTSYVQKKVTKEIEAGIETPYSSIKARHAVETGTGESLDKAKAQESEFKIIIPETNEDDGFIRCYRFYEIRKGYFVKENKEIFTYKAKATGPGIVFWKYKTEKEINEAKEGPPPDGGKTKNQPPGDKPPKVMGSGQAKIDPPEGPKTGEDKKKKDKGGTK